MNVEKTIRARRSIRKYEDKEVSDKIIKRLINAARLAPTGNNAQPQRYLIIKDKETIAKLKENSIFKQDFVYNSPVIIICCSDPDAYPKSKMEEGLDDPYKIRAIRDVSIASENLVLQATEFGLGTCYVGWLNKIKIKKMLNIPRDFVIPYAITLGYPAETPHKTSRKELEHFILK